jgi:hypothetical protein
MIFSRNTCGVDCCRLIRFSLLPAGGSAVNLVPHWSQNFAPGGCTFPQEGHVLPSGFPQFWQNFAPGALLNEQLVHWILDFRAAIVSILSKLHDEKSRLFAGKSIRPESRKSDI